MEGGSGGGGETGDRRRGEGRGEESGGEREEMEEMEEMDATQGPPHTLSLGSGAVLLFVVWLLSLLCSSPPGG